MKTLQYNLGVVSWNALLNSYVEYDNQGRMIRKVSSPAAASSASKTKESFNKVISPQSPTANLPTSTVPTATSSPTLPAQNAPVAVAAQDNTFLYLIVFGVAAFLLMN